jgi:hypothetical protein
LSQDSQIPQIFDPKEVQTWSYKLRHEFAAPLFMIQDPAIWSLTTTMQRAGVFVGDRDIWPHIAAGLQRARINPKSYELSLIANSGLTSAPEVFCIGDHINDPIPEDVWIVENLLIAGGMSILSSTPKCGKSTLARQIMFSVLRGDDLWGRETKQGPVMYYVLEEIQHKIVEAFRKIGVVLGERIFCRPGVQDPVGFITTLFRDIEEYSPSLVVVDPLIDVLGVPDLNHYQEVNMALKAIVGPLRANQCHLLCLHHAPKAGTSHLGSTALAAATDANLYMSTGQDGRRWVWSEQRYGRPIPESWAKFHPRTNTVTLIEGKQ